MIQLRLGLSLLVALLSVSPAFAQVITPSSSSGVGTSPYDFEVVTVSTSAVGLTAAKITPATGQPASYLSAMVETASIRCRVDGTDPSATVGILFNANDRFTIHGLRTIEALKCIRTGGTNGSLVVTYYR